MSLRRLGLCLLLAASMPIGAQRAGSTSLASTPPMGWNSWDAYGTTVREEEVKATADVMARELKGFGWEYVVVDIQWSEPNPKSHGYRAGAKLTMDAYGRLQPAPNRFPSAANGQGFKALADYVHKAGLKFGIHIMRGIPRQAVEGNLPIAGTSLHAREIANTSSTCEWNTDMYGVDVSKRGGQDYYDSLVEMYAKWGVDFIKADDMSRPFHTDEIEALHKAIRKSGRPIVLSLSPGPAPLDKIGELRADAQMWRIADDLWDNWASVKEMYYRTEKWIPLVQPGHWPDADMLPLGHIGLRAERGDDRLSSLTHDEQQTLMTLWCIFRSPLMYGGDLLTLDAYTRSLLTNREVISVNQHSTANRVVFSEGSLRAWTAVAADGSSYVALFNLGDELASSSLSWQQLKLDQHSGLLENLWTGEHVAAAKDLAVSLPPHGSLLYRVGR